MTCNTPKKLLKRIGSYFSYSNWVRNELVSYMYMCSQCLMMMVYCSAPSVKYTYDVAMVHTDGSQKQAALLLTGMV